MPPQMSFDSEGFSGDLIPLLQAQYSVFPHIILRLNRIDKRFPCTCQERELVRSEWEGRVMVSRFWVGITLCAALVVSLLCLPWAHPCFPSFLPSFLGQLVASTGHCSPGSCCATCADLSLQPWLGTFLLVAVRKTHRASTLGWPR